MSTVNSFGAQSTLTVGSTDYEIFRIDTVPGFDKLPFSLKVLLENLLRTEDGANVTKAQIEALGSWDAAAEPNTEIQFTPARVVMQDFTGVPCIVDLATMREAVTALGGDANKINPLSPAEMVIDHSVIADLFGSENALERNVEIEYERNGERYQFLRWGQGAFDDFKVVPPGTGIVHQVNIEHLAKVAKEKSGGNFIINLRYNEQLGEAKDFLDGIKVDSFQGAFVAYSYAPAKTPLQGVLDMPFLPIPDLVTQARVLDAYQAWKPVSDELSKWNAMHFMTLLLPQYEFMGTGKPPRNLEDWKGMRVRALGGLGIFLGTRAAVLQAAGSADRGQHFRHRRGVAVLHDGAQALAGGGVRMGHGMDQRQRGLALGEVVAQVLAQLLGIG